MSMQLNEYIKSKSQNGPVYMPYLTVGDPDFDRTVEYALAMIEAGADIIELGIPFSDPTADGPVIQQAMVRALSQSDFSLEKVFQVAAAIHKARPEIPLVFLTYLNPILTGFLQRTPGNKALRSLFDVRQNIETFLKECHTAGIRGVVIPDLPFEAPESEMIRQYSSFYRVEQIMMIAPNTSKKRFKRVCKVARGFIYYVTSMGVTGERKELPVELKSNVRKIQKMSGLPVLAGFGINQPEQVQPLVGVVDGVIVGSLHHRIIQEAGAGAGQKLSDATRGFVEALRSQNGASRSQESQKNQESQES